MCVCVCVCDVRARRNIKEGETMGTTRVCVRMVIWNLWIRHAARTVIIILLVLIILIASVDDGIRTPPLALLFDYTLNQKKKNRNNSDWYTCTVDITMRAFESNSVTIQDDYFFKHALTFFHASAAHMFQCWFMKIACAPLYDYIYSTHFCRIFWSVSNFSV
jgi:hypothetical protein